MFPRRLTALALCAAVLFVGPAACRPRPEKKAGRPERSGSVKLLVTRDFGTRLMKEKTVKTSGSATVLEMLSRNAKVETAYGGGFVNSIDGLASGNTSGGSSKNDWFYYVNGVLASVGAGEYQARPEDRIWWDYHSWEKLTSIPAVVGAYPEPFAHGYAGKAVPTQIVYARGFAHEAGSLRDGMIRMGVADVGFSPLTPHLKRGGGKSLVLVGTWGQLAGLGLVKEAAAQPGTSGLFVRFEKGQALMLGCNGEVADTQRRAGAVMATAGETGSGAVVWLVTGVDGPSVGRAADVMVKRPSELAGKFGIVVDEAGNVIPVPRAGT